MFEFLNCRRTGAGGQAKDSVKTGYILTSHPTTPAGEPEPEQGLDFVAIREGLGLNRGEMAKMAGVSKAMWRRVESGERRLSENTLFCFLHAVASHFADEHERRVLRETAEIVNRTHVQLLTQSWPKRPARYRTHRYPSGNPPKIPNQGGPP